MRCSQAGGNLRLVLTIISPRKSHHVMLPRKIPKTINKDCPEETDFPAIEAKILIKLKIVYHLTGDYSYLLKVRCEKTKDLEKLITDFIKEQGFIIDS